MVIQKPDMPALVPANCHIGKGDVEEGAQQGEGGAWDNCESLDPELERLLAGHCVKEDQSVEVGTFNYIKCGMSTNVQTGEMRVLFWYGMPIIPKKIPEPNKNNLCMRFPNNHFDWFKRADAFPTLPPGLPVFFNDACDVPSDETSDYGEAPSDESSENGSSDDEDAGDDGYGSEDGASGTPKAKKEKKKKTKPKPPKLRKYTKMSRSPDVLEEALASRIPEATEDITPMELFKQASAYSTYYLIKLCENLCVSGMSSKTIPEILGALEDRSKSGGFTIQKPFPPHKPQVSFKSVDISMSSIRQASIAVQCLLMLLLAVRTFVVPRLPHLGMH